MTAYVLRGDARELPLPDASVDLIVTSPPYFGLRSYTDGGEHYAGQIGSEATPAEWLGNLLACTREWVRVLKPSGSLFVNLGDKYAGVNPGSYRRHTQPVDGGMGYHLAAAASEQTANHRPNFGSTRDKSLLGLPWRYALNVTDQLGLILRAEIIWAKPNGLPESVTDRVRRAHEQVFHFTRQPRYYSAVDEIREAHQEGRRLRDASNDTRRYEPWMSGYINSPPNPLGKLPGSVWQIPSQPLAVPAHLGVDHFAAFPMELPRRIILGWSPPGICTACGEGRRPVSDYTPEYAQHRGPGTDWNRHLRAANGYDGTGDRRAGTRPLSASRIISRYVCACEWHRANCDCWTCRAETTRPAPTRPAVVLDPFGGTGTTALIASAYGRTGISIDRSSDYSRLARWRTTDSGQRAAALEVDKPPAVMDGQGELFAI